MNHMNHMNHVYYEWLFSNKEFIIIFILFVCNSYYMYDIIQTIILNWSTFKAQMNIKSHAKQLYCLI